MVDLYEFKILFSDMKFMSIQYFCFFLKNTGKKFYQLTCKLIFTWKVDTHLYHIEKIHIGKYKNQTMHTSKTFSSKNWLFLYEPPLCAFKTGKLEAPRTLYPHLDTISLLVKILKGEHPRVIVVKFFFIWPSDFRGVDF